MATYSSIAYDFAPATADCGALKLITTVTASASATVSLVDGTSNVVLDNTYKTYIIKFVNIHLAANGPEILWNASADAGSNYDVVKTTTFFSARHEEAEAEAGDLGLRHPSSSVAQSSSRTVLARLVAAAGGNSDCSVCGEIWLFSPSDTTFVTHYMASMSVCCDSNPYPEASEHTVAAGYFNTTSAVNAILFSTSDGNIDTGDFKLYGIA